MNKEFGTSRQLAEAKAAASSEVQDMQRLSLLGRTITNLMRRDNSTFGDKLSSSVSDFDGNQIVRLTMSSIDAKETSVTRINVGSQEIMCGVPHITANRSLTREFYDGHMGTLFSQEYDALKPAQQNTLPLSQVEAVVNIVRKLQADGRR